MLLCAIVRIPEQVEALDWVTLQKARKKEKLMAALWQGGGGAVGGWAVSVEMDSGQAGPVRCTHVHTGCKLGH